MIIERDDYITKEEYDRCKKIIVQAQTYVDEFKNKDFETRGYRYDSCTIEKDEKKKHFIMYEYRDYGRRPDPIYMTYEQCDLYGIKEVMTSLCEKRYCRYVLSSDVLYLLSRFEEVRDAIYRYTKYEERIINVDKFNNKNHFKDVYEVIKNVEEKYE